MRVVEIMGIEQARQWGACTVSAADSSTELWKLTRKQMNEFRKFMGLRPFGTFEEWNSDPDVAVSISKFRTC